MKAAPRVRAGYATGPVLKVGDSVVRLRARRGIGSAEIAGTMRGTVLAIAPQARAGGVANVRVRWENGHEGRVDNRYLKVTP